MARGGERVSIVSRNEQLVSRPFMFLFPRPFAAVLAAFITSGLVFLLSVLLHHAGS
jgi:hypothetical protein